MAELNPLNPHLAVAPVTAGVALPDARMVALLVHGRDQDEEVMLDVVARLALPDVGYVLPVAAGRSWYPGRYFDPVADNQPHVDWALEAFASTLAVAAAAGVPDERTVVAGFSQGACLIAELVARAPRPWAGAGVLTGTLLGPRGGRVTPAPGVAGLKMLFASSRHDAWIEPEDAVVTAEAFAGAGAAVTLELSDNREHVITDAAVDGLRRLFG